jgi:sugar O-acyltransferase (sialic acid O-acetyltransferase NeuD family)
LTKVVVLGAGGNCRDIVDAMLDAGGFEPLGYLDDDPGKTQLSGLPILGPLSSWADHDGVSFVNGLNGDQLTRRKPQLLAGLGIPRERFVTVVHPTASVSRMATVGIGTVLLQHVTVNSAATIGDHVMVLPNSVVSHDAVVGDHSYLTPGVVLAGYVRVGEAAYIGAGAVVKHRVTIGDGAVVGMGSVVLHDVPPGATVYGNPAR